MSRIAVVKRQDCRPVNCGDHLCIRLCPINRTGAECIVKSDGKIAIDEPLCTGCGICSTRCPFGAISIINLPEQLTQKAIHRYGQNGFALYSLPTPMFGKVVGVLGKNGIGKSTAIKILAGELKPNFEEFYKESGYDDLIEYFKGSESQLFFEKVKAGEIKVSYKPQQVDLIPKTASGNVGDLLKKVDETGNFDDIVDKLALRKILDTDIKDISGGELQRIAIAATVLKKANLYVFDEPTSYLDVKQRIIVSKFIRELANEDTAVLVVEHDLIILDYMTDLVHIMYGKEGVYGVVSQPKATRSGVNVYLDGYLKEENMRFRDYRIKFEKAPPAVSREKVMLTCWEGVVKTLGRFHISAPFGELSKSIVTGVLGENGIGKTSFARILAGEIEAEGKIQENVKVSYKSQYLDSNEEPVAAVLHDAVKKYSNQLIKPMQIERLLTKKLSELSGGELQRVAIARCLSQDADLYLLDEPSAYLDVEQRLAISKIIKDVAEDRGKTVLVIDHDLLFIDYLSEKLIVFSGEPAVKGVVEGPYPMAEGMNQFLEDLGITFRRDPDSHRPRVNKPGSQMDRKQREEGKLYYV